MSTPSPTLPTLFPRLKPRILLMLVAFIVVISATVIATDFLSPRNRSPLPAAASASQP